MPLILAAAAAQSGDFTWPDVAALALFVVLALGFTWLFLR